jgi:hypothetical protein
MLYYKMKTEQIVMCVVALALGMLVANMLTNVCGCKTRVEGLSFGSDKDATGRAMINAGINEIDARSILNDSAGDGCMSGDQMCSGPPWTGSLAPDKIDQCFQTRGVGTALGAGGRSSSFYGQFCPEPPPPPPCNTITDIGECGTTDGCQFCGGTEQGTCVDSGQCDAFPENDDCPIGSWQSCDVAGTLCTGTGVDGQFKCPA